MDVAVSLHTMLAMLAPGPNQLALGMTGTGREPGIIAWEVFYVSWDFLVVGLGGGGCAYGGHGDDGAQEE